MRHTLLSACLLLTSVAFGATTASAQDFPAEHEAARTELPRLLTELGEWCVKKRLHDRAAAVAKEILAIDPDHADAHKWLGFVRGRDGSWNPGKRRPKKGDLDKAALAQYPLRRADIVSPHTTRVLALLDVFPGLASGRREQVLTDLIALSPAARAVRKRHGEVETRPGEWALAETVKAGETRALLRQVVEAAFAEIGTPAAVEASTFQKQMGVEWRGVQATEHVQALSTSSAAEASRAVLCAEAAPAVLAAAIGAKRKLWQPYRLFLLHNETCRVDFLKAHPAMIANPGHKRRARGLGGYWLPDTSDFATWLSPGARRVDATTRQTVNKLLLVEFRIDSGKQAWAGEGFGLRLAWQICGTRLNWMVGESRYANAEGSDLRGLTEDEDWYRAAREVLASADGPDLRDVLHRPLRIFTGADALIAHALAAYLLEARPETCNDLLRRVGAGEKAEDALLAATGLDILALRLRLERWLSERSPTPK